MVRSTYVLLKLSVRRGSGIVRVRRPTLPSHADRLSSAANHFSDDFTTMYMAERTSSALRMSSRSDHRTFGSRELSLQLSFHAITRSSPRLRWEIVGAKTRTAPNTYTCILKLHTSCSCVAVSEPLGQMDMGTDIHVDP